jgi:hypothetical protein
MQKFKTFVTFLDRGMQFSSLPQAQETLIMALPQILLIHVNCLKLKEGMTAIFTVLMLVFQTVMPYGFVGRYLKVHKA